MELNSFFNVVSVEDAVDRLKWECELNSNETFIMCFNVEIRLLIRKGSLDAFIYDTALLDYVQANDSRCTLKTAGASFGSQGYAVVFPKGFQLKVNWKFRFGFL